MAVATFYTNGHTQKVKGKESYPPALSSLLPSSICEAVTSHHSLHL